MLQAVGSGEVCQRLILQSAQSWRGLRAKLGWGNAAPAQAGLLARLSADGAPSPTDHTFIRGL